jgi:hypothetical protein
MAENILLLSKYFYDENYENIATSMIKRVVNLILIDPEFAAGWASVAYLLNDEIPEIAIVGDEALAMGRAIQTRWLKKVVVATSGKEVPLLSGKKTIDGKTTIYVCFNKSCKQPVHSLEEAFEQLK